MDSAGLTQRRYVSLGQDRVQAVFNALDSSWSVAVYKVRGEPQYGFIAIDLRTCEEQLPVELPSLVKAATFASDNVELQLEKGETRKFPLGLGLVH